jgi:hypothetical protein
VPKLRRLFLPWRPGFEPRSGHVGFVGDKVALGQVFSVYFGCFPYQFLFHWLLHIHHRLSSGAGTIGQLVADVPSGPSLTPPQETKKKKKKIKTTQQSVITDGNSECRSQKSIFLWDMTPCSPVVHRCYRRASSGLRVSQASNHKDVVSKYSSVNFFWTTRRHVPEDSTLHNYPWENFK